MGLTKKINIPFFYTFGKFRETVGLTKKFETLMEPTDYQLLVSLSKHYGLSKAAIVRLALRDLHEKIQTPANPSAEPLSPILRKPESATPPPELDPFWQDFRR